MRANTEPASAQPRGPMENKPALLAIIAVLVLNAWRLQRKYERGQAARYDGVEAPVTKVDLLIAWALVLLLIAGYVYYSFWG